MKKMLLFITIGITFCACGPKAKMQPVTLHEKFEQLDQSIKDSTLSFEMYEPLVVEVLDSLENIVCNNPDAEKRFFARRLPIKLFTVITNTEPEYKRESIWARYHSRRNKILSMWYVQQLIDSVSNNPFIVISYAAPYDSNGNDTRVGFTFCESSNPEVEPIMLITLPVVTDDPAIFFCKWDENDIEYHSDLYVGANQNIEVFVDSIRTTILMSGHFLQDMLSYEQIDVCYFNDKTHQYNNVENVPLEDRVTKIPVCLHFFQEQYQSAHQWMFENK